MLMARKIEMKPEEYSPEQFNRWARELGVSSRCDYTDFEFRERCKRIEEAKFAQMNPVVTNPSDDLRDGLQNDQGTIFSGIKSILNFF